MKRRLSFAAPFVITIACGGPRRDPTEVRDPEPMRDIAQPEYELAIDAAVPDGPPDAVAADLPPVIVTTGWRPPTCYQPGNPPGRGPCAASRILKLEIVGSATRITFIGGTQKGMKKGQRVVLANTSIWTTIDQCEERYCVATLKVTPDQVTTNRYVYVVIDE